MIEILNLFDTQEKEKYKQILDSIGCISPYYRLEYFQYFSSGIANLKAIIWYDKDSIILIPGYSRPINDYDGYYDFITPYGYSGPKYSPTVKHNFQAFWKEIDAWFKTNNYVSAFFRFSLDDNFEAYTGELKNTMLNVKGRISSPEEQWKNYEYKVRKNVKRAINENLTFSLVPGREMTSDLLKEFYHIYIDTMKRTHATTGFFYDINAFESFTHSNAETCAYAFVQDGKVNVSTELVLIDPPVIYSFLGGTLNEYFNKRPNDFLKHEVINWARKHNYSHYVLGGGFGSDDGIFKYKASFFPNDIIPYYTGRSIFNVDLYNELVNNSIHKSGLTNDEVTEQRKKDFFPEYRRNWNIL